LPGSYYLQVVQQLFKENRLASGTFVALGQRIDLSRCAARCFCWLLATTTLWSPSRYLQHRTW
jgi:poly(3-hydroxyalkanoate) synthetase